MSTMPILQTKAIYPRFHDGATPLTGEAAHTRIASGPRRTQVGLAVRLQQRVAGAFILIAEGPGQDLLTPPLALRVDQRRYRVSKL
jgi:hypothetical protein